MNEGNVMNTVTGVRDMRRRICEYDWLRFFAVAMVIITHAIQADIAGGRIQGETAQYFMTVIYVVALSCNLIYVMLSGALLIPYREEKLSDFYLRRVSRVVLPMIVYYGIYLGINRTLADVTGSKLLEAFRRLYTGEVPESPHFWLMYVILGTYIVIPFFRYMFRDMPYRVITSMTLVSWLFMFLMTYIPVKCAVNPILSSWIGVAVTGYWMSRKETRAYDKHIIAAGLAGLAVTMYVIKTGGDFLTLCCNCSPTMLMMACAVFALVFRFPVLFSKSNPLLDVISKYSYSIILIHWTVLFVITQKVLHIYTSDFYYIGGIFLNLLVTLLISLAGAVIVDNTIVFAVEKVFDGIVTGIQNIVRRFIRNESNRR